MPNKAKPISERIRKICSDDFEIRFFEGVFICAWKKKLSLQSGAVPSEPNLRSHAGRGKIRPQLGERG